MFHRKVVVLLVVAAAAARAAPGPQGAALEGAPAPFLREVLAPAASSPNDVRIERARIRSGSMEERAAAQAEAAARAFVELRPHLVGHPPLEPALRRLEDVGDLARRLQAAVAERPAGPGAAAERTERITQLSAALEVARQDYQARLDAGAKELRAVLQRPTVLVVAGGSSLGAYEAGFLHYTTQYLGSLGDLVQRLALPPGPDPGVFPVATGASAGAVNAFLAAIASCREPVARPEDSIFYRVWIPVGMSQLLGGDPEPGALFSRAPLAAAVRTAGALLESDRGWSPERPCRTLFGVSVTPIRSRTLEIRTGGDEPGAAGGVTVHRHTEKFMFEVAGEPGKPPRLRPFTPPLPAGADPVHATLYPAFSPVRADGSVEFADFAELLQASSSLPLVFRPVKLSYRLGGDREERTQRFIDGGILDNTPLRLALRMQRWQAERGGAADPWVLFLEPDARAWEAFGESQRPKRARASNVAEYLDSFGDFVSAAREAELADAIEAEPHLGRRLLIPGGQMPLASAHLRNLLGFFEEDFRISDFHMGMADAQDHLWRGSEAFHVLEANGALPGIDSAVFACYAAHRAELREGRDPAPETLPQCHALGADDRPSARNALALLRASRGMKAWSRSPDHDEARELERFLALLDRYGYEFRDLRYRGRPATARTALKAIRDVMQRQVQALGALEKNVGIRMGVVTVGKALANEVAFRIPRQFSFVGLQIDSGVEAGYARQLLHEQLRLVLTGKVYAFDRNLTRSSYEHGVNAATYAGSARAVLEIPWSNVLQPEMGLGWGIYSRDGWGRHLFWRHGPEASLGLSIYQRLYLDVAVTWFLDACAGNNACAQVASRYRDDPVPLVLYRREVRGSVGWRFLID